MIRLLRTIDAHAGGQSFRLLVEGAPRPLGKTLVQRAESLERQADWIRRALVLPPRGHQDLTAALFTEPVSPEAHAGILFMDAAGYPEISGHGLLAAATIAIERGLIFSRESAGDSPRLVFDTPAGTVRTELRAVDHAGSRRVDSVRMAGMPAFVHAAGRSVTVGARHLRVDVAFGGAFFAIVDSESTGIPLVCNRVSDLRRMGEDICAALNASAPPGHPVQEALSGVAGVIFTGPPHDPEAHLRNVTIGQSGAVDISPGAAGTSAVMAILDAMGVLPEGQTFVHEGLSGGLFRGRVTGRTEVGDIPALLTDIEGSAWVTGEHTLLVDDDDPFREGIDQ